MIRYNNHIAPLSKKPSQSLIVNTVILTEKIGKSHNKKFPDTFTSMPDGKSTGNSFFGCKNFAGQIHLLLYPTKFFCTVSANSFVFVCNNILRLAAEDTSRGIFLQYYPVFFRKDLYAVSCLQIHKTSCLYGEHYSAQLIYFSDHSQ